jgi:hypothetical protein
MSKILILWIGSDHGEPLGASAYCKHGRNRKARTRTGSSVVQKSSFKLHQRAPSQHSMNFPSMTRYASADRCASERWWRKFGMEACRERAARFFPRPPCCTVARNRLFQRYSILARSACSAPSGARSTLMWSWHAHLTEQRPSPAKMAAREPAPSNWTHLHSRQARSFD